MKKLNKTILKSIKAKLLDIQQQTSSNRDFLDPSSQGSDEVDLAQSLVLNDMAERLALRDKELLGKVSRALQKIEDKTFGYCELCEEPIGEKRLEAIPLSVLCVGCAEDIERRSKHFR